MKKLIKSYHYLNDALNDLRKYNSRKDGLYILLTVDTMTTITLSDARKKEKETPASKPLFGIYKTED